MQQEQQPLHQRLPHAPPGKETTSAADQQLHPLLLADPPQTVYDAAPPRFVDAPAAVAAEHARSAIAASPLGKVAPDALASGGKGVPPDVAASEMLAAGASASLANFPRRVLQFSAVALYSSLLFINIAILIFLAYNWRIIWPFALCYFSYIFLIDSATPYTGGTDRWAFIRQWSFWRGFGEYFGAELVKTAELDPAKNYIFGYHPHGIYAYGLFPNFITQYSGFAKKFPGITLRFSTLDINWSIPIWREIQMGLGTVSVSAKSLKHILTKKGPGWSALIVIGGADEALMAYPNTNDIILNRRKGFVKVAIQTGASLVPVFTFGENDLFWQVNDESAPAIRKAQQRLAKLLTYSLPIYWGRLGMFFLPRKTRLVSVVGKPINVVQNDNPTREEIADLHARYVQELIALFDAHKDTYIPHREKDLHII
ncbi:diacylglycerol O-acyltransferase 1 [Geranomyces variabilis]|uniref:Diacylglycerol O-acyltransferase n=1 Tax=Geranomyces variabilis TaxID=109894 RepID=A0AAD5TMP4_9FUNG|nr:diacylglycerol O-acyltransferase 1 [Geranomyces variabilis]